MKRKRTSKTKKSNQETSKLDEVLDTLDQNPSAVQTIINELQYNEKDLLQAVKINEECFKYINDSFKKEKFILSCIKKNEKVYRYVDKKLKDDVQFIDKAIQSNYKIYDFLHDKFKNDRTIIHSTLISSKGIGFMKFSESLRSDESIILEACTYFFQKNKNCKHPLHYLSKSLLDDRALILKLFQSHNGCIGGYGNISLRLKQDPLVLGVMMYHLRHDPYVQFRLIFDNIPLTVIQNRELMMHLVQINPNLINYLTTYKNDKQVVMKALEVDALLFTNFLHFNDDEDVARLVASKQGSFLNLFSNKFFKDRNIVLLALKNQHFISGTSHLKNIYKLLPKYLQEDREIIYESLKRGFTYETLEYVKNNPEKDLLIQGLTHFLYGNFDKYIDEAYCIQIKEYIENVIPNDLKEDKSFMLDLLKKESTFYTDYYETCNYGKLGDYLSENLKKDKEFVKILMEFLKYDLDGVKSNKNQNQRYFDLFPLNHKPEKPQIYQKLDSFYEIFFIFQ